MNRIDQYPLPNQSERGMTLIEILVALVISLFLIAGVIQLFVGTKQTYRFHDALSRLQENGRFALEAMSTDIRMAGFQYSPTPDDAIQDTGNILTSRWIDDVTTTPTGLCSGQANCSFRRYSVQARTAGGTAPTCPTAGTSLFLQRDNAAAQELVEGVEAMQLLYGVCTTDADGDGVNDSVTPPYVNEAAVTAAGNWPNVCSVRIHLLLVSLDNNVVTQPQTINFPADNIATINRGDRCLRQAFSTTVVIRNRMP